ncbi:MAG: U32 family peptidase [Kiritimatiellae bacterium]|nr:U32 family peptidase [Kiritimatiellia bacterium]
MEVELLSPAGNFDTALAAFEAGADAVYLGLNDYSARSFADNFAPSQLRDLMRVAKKRGKKVYVTFNTIIDEDRIEGVIEALAELNDIKPDALIVQDIGVARLARKYFPDLELHASTQLVAHNLEGVLAMKELGFKRVVLARELSLEEIQSISKRSGVELEVFVHGALCYSISGLCLFGAMEKGRSGNRGKCPYCCRLPYENEEGKKTLAFSMKDLRVGEDVRRLIDSGVVSLKIEGRMKSELYVASVTKYYRQLLDGTRGVTTSDLETVFSRRTTKLYLDKTNKEPVIDPDSLGHLGAEIGVIKRITKDREGLLWLRFHTSRALEKHDGLQFAASDGGTPLGMGISEMRQAISRRSVFEVLAGTDVEILVSEELARDLKSGMKVYQSASQAVKRAFPIPSFRPSDYEGREVIDIEVTLLKDKIVANGHEIVCSLEKAKNPDKTYEGVKKAFSKLGETEYRLGTLKLNDPEKLFAPMSVLNDLRRDLVEALDEEREKKRRESIERANNGEMEDVCSAIDFKTLKTVKLYAGQKIPSGDFDEIIITIDPLALHLLPTPTPLYRLATPVYTKEPDFNKLRVAVKGLIRKGFTKWEASDLATLRMLKLLGVKDITADWTLYAFNLSALKELSSMGVKRFVASPENTRENLQFLAESGYHVEFLAQQSTPLFISLNTPAANPVELEVFERGGLWVTTKKVPRTFDLPEGVSTRLDLSWDK